MDMQLLSRFQNQMLNAQNNNELTNDNFHKFKTKLNPNLVVRTTTELYKPRNEERFLYWVTELYINELLYI